MENQHRKISGYRELSQEEIDLMNSIKAFGPELEQLCENIRKHLGRQNRAAIQSDYPDEFQRLQTANPQMWRDKGAASLQEGLMFLTRAVAQPTFF